MGTQSIDPRMGTRARRQCLQYQGGAALKLVCSTNWRVTYWRELPRAPLNKVRSQCAGSAFRAKRQDEMIHSRNDMSHPHN